MNQQTENNKLINSFLKRTFFRAWQNPEEKGLGVENFQTVELWLNNKCNLACKYCYLNRYGNDLYSPELQDDKKVLKNLDIFLDWLIENKFAPRLELFGGEPLVQEVGLKGLEMILEKYKNIEKKPSAIIVPTNYTFLLSDKLTKRIESLLQKSRKIGIPISLSASFDGKYCEENRPFRGARPNQPGPRNDKYYQRAFAFSKKWKCGFHPMIYSEKIENWKDNFLWFQKNFKKHNIAWYNIYLLEIRNQEWTDEQILKFADFIDFLIKWTFKNPCQNNPAAFIDFSFRDKGYNILSTPLTTCGRGIGCSIQSCFHLRLGDLAWVPCHRTSYPPFVYAFLKVENNKIVGIKANNPELMVGIYSLEQKNSPQCEICLLKNLCSKGCLGSQFETTGDLFSPIPTVCQLEHAKISAMIKAYKDLKIYDVILDRIDPDKADALRWLEKILYE